MGKNTKNPVFIKIETESGSYWSRIPDNAIILICWGYENFFCWANSVYRILLHVALIRKQRTLMLYLCMKCLWCFFILLNFLPSSPKLGLFIVNKIIDCFAWKKTGPVLGALRIKIQGRSRVKWSFWYRHISARFLFGALCCLSQSVGDLLSFKEHDLKWRSSGDLMLLEKFLKWLYHAKFYGHCNNSSPLNFGCFV